MILTNEVPFVLEPADDDLVRAYISRLWADDWDSPEDEIHDE